MNITKALWRSALAVVMAVGMFACSKSGDSVEKLQYFSADDMTIIALNLNDIVDNTGSSYDPAKGFTLSPSLTKLIGSGNNQFLNMRGVDLKDFMISIDNYDMFSVIGLTDPDAFINYLTSNNEDAELVTVGDYKAMDDNGSVILIKDNTLFYVKASSPAAAIQKIEDRLAAAKQKPLSDAVADVLANHGTFAMSIAYAQVLNMSHANNADMVAAREAIQQMGINIDFNRIANSTMVINSKLEGNEFSGKGYLVDADGKRVKIDIDMSTVDTDMLCYANSNDIMVFMTSMPKLDWGKVLNAMAQSNRQMREISSVAPMVSAFLDKINGSILIAGGPRGMRFDSFGAWDVVFAIPMDNESAAQYLSMLQGLVSSMLQSRPCDGGFCITIPGEGDIYFVNHKGTLVAATRPVTTDGGSSIKASTFKDAYNGFAFNLPKSSMLLSLIGSPSGVHGHMVVDDNNETEFEIELDDCSGKLLENVIELVAKFN